MLRAFLLPISIMAQRGGICYDPVHVGPSVFSAETIANDMIQIKANGFTHVRTFKVTYGNGMDMGPLITQAGLTAALGIPLRGETTEESNQQLMAAIQAAQSGNAGYIFIGNENLANQDIVPQQMLEYIQYAKANVPSHVKVGTIQRNTEFLDPNRNVTGFQNLLEECQIVGVNVHPFFTPNLDVNDAIYNVRDQWNAVMTIYGSIAHKIVLTEVGWPSGGNVGGSYGDIQAAERFFNDFSAWSEPFADDEKFYFQMYDQPYKGQYGGPEFETKFGLFTADGTAKFNLPPVVPQETSAAQIPDSTPDAPAVEVANTAGEVAPPSASLASPPTMPPTSPPTRIPTLPPSRISTSSPTAPPTETPTKSPTKTPTKLPTNAPTKGTTSPAPSTAQQTFSRPRPVSATQTSAATHVLYLSRRIVICVTVCVTALIGAGSFC